MTAHTVIAFRTETRAAGPHHRGVSPDFPPAENTDAFWDAVIAASEPSEADHVAWARTTPHHSRLRARGPMTGQMPVSWIHAAEIGAARTVCGLSVSSLEGFGSWGSGGVDRCPECRTVADARSAS